MRAEAAKIRALPTPRWMVIIAVAIGVLIAVGIVIDAPSDPDVYSEGGFAGSAITAILSLVLGVWIIGLEYGQGTMRRAVSVTPDRVRLLAAKMGVLLICVVAGTVLIGLYFWLVVAGSGIVFHGADISTGELPDEIGAALVINVGYAVLAFSVALLTRSMAGGIAGALIVALVVDTLLGVIPSAGDYTFGQSIDDFSKYVRGDEVDLPGRAAALTAAWLLALSAASWLWFDRQDIK